ncbi:MAG: Hpt domain-containing protein, partial [Spirochaetota bacterium]
INTAKGLRVWQDGKVYTKALQDFARRNSGSATVLGDLLFSEKVEEAYRMTHALKGVAGNLAIEDVENWAIEMDAALKHKDIPKARSFLPELASALETALRSIESFCVQEKNQTQQVGPEFQLAEVQTLSAQLSELFAKGEAADDLLETFCGMLRGHVPEVLLDEFRLAIEYFDFDTGLEKLETIMQTLAKNLENSQEAE